jgi:hypothetical protein
VVIRAFTPVFEPVKELSRGPPINESSLRKQGPNIRAFTPVFDGLYSCVLSIGHGVAYGSRLFGRDDRDGDFFTGSFAGYARQ